VCIAVRGCYIEQNVSGPKTAVAVKTFYLDNDKPITRPSYTARKDDLTCDKTDRNTIIKRVFGQVNYILIILQPTDDIESTDNHWFCNKISEQGLK